MTEDLSKDDILKVYEIGYLLISSIPAEKVADTVAVLKDVLSKKGAVMIAEENPELCQLAYTMIKKIGTTNQRFDHGYFGWFKFEVSAGVIEEIKKSFEAHADTLRILLITTIRENTYLGQKAPEVMAGQNVAEGVSDKAPSTEPLPILGLGDKADTSSASVEEIDKSIDEMVKGA